MARRRKRLTLGDIALRESLYAAERSGGIDRAIGAGLIVAAALACGLLGFLAGFFLFGSARPAWWVAAIVAVAAGLWLAEKFDH